jgi:hypothetical protein
MKRKYSARIKTTTLVVLTTQLFQLVYPTIGFALTGGPSQPEVQSFEPVGTSDMVDLFSGDFNYNIPLLDVGGYPINIAYHAGINMDQEASWVGLGWNINAGVINREMRGLPDDFKGDIIKKESKMRPNRTYGLSIALPIKSTELFGVKIFNKLEKAGMRDKVMLNLGVNYNNYKGVGVNFGAAPVFDFADNSSTKLNARIGFNYSSSGGFDVSPNLNFSTIYGETEDVVKGKKFDQGFGASLGATMNSRYGLQTLNFGTKFTAQEQGKNKEGNDYGEREKSFSGSHSFGIKTYTPNISMPMRSHAFTFNLAFGPAVTLFPNTSYTGTYSEQKLAISSSQKPAYGYLYEQEHPTVNTIEDHDFLLDFNRENDGSYSKKTMNLPITNHTYDIYSVSGQGVGGSYRPFRSDIGIIGDDYAKTTSTSANGGIELGTAMVAHWGANLNMSFHTSESGAWIGDEAKWTEGKDKSYKNISRNIYGFRNTEIGQTTPDFEPSYFKKAGEMSPLDNQFYQVMRGNLTVAPDPTSFDESSRVNFFTTRNVQPILGNTGVPVGKFFYGGTTGSYKNDVIRRVRDKRNEVFSQLNNQERLIAGQTKYMQPQEKINQRIDRYWVNSPIISSRPAHHTSEITILGEDGMRYVYGYAAYNNFQKEKTFNISTRTKFVDKGQALYTNDQNAQDNSTNNKLGRDDFYSSTETPAYAHSYLLTGIVSNDYVDLTGNGITNDDYGTSVKINYVKTQSAYRWRVPYDVKTVSLIEGERHTNLDDKGTYVYGEKEIWHMSTIESKTHIAFFRLSRREDALGVVGEDGGKDTSMRSYKLDRIELYSKQEIQLYGQNAKPVKVVNFQYEYSLCPNVDNNSGLTSVDGNANKGKLTLKKIWFSYGSSYRGRIAPYIFEYAGINSQPGINPSYNLKGNDAWGTYKEMLGNNNLPSGNLSNADFPYTDSDSATTTKNSFAWSLTQIQLPSGGKIKINYEADDYAYVENKRAMEMFKIVGFGRSEDHLNKGMRVFYPTGVQRHMDILFFNLKEQYTGSSAQEFVKTRYLDGVQFLQFTVHANIKDGNYEYVKGYAEIDWEKGCGITSNGLQGWVALKTVGINDKDASDADARHRVSPIAKTIWNFAKMHTPELIYPEPGQENQSLTKQVLSLFNVFGTDLYRSARGINKSLEDQKFGAFVTDKSWVRLSTPNKKRYGGGHRVKKIELSDEWQAMAYPSDNNAGASYGQEYSYSMMEKQANGEFLKISSGVATNLPAGAGDENPLTQPRFTEVENILVPDEESYDDRPIGESFFASPQVGYRKVTVKSLTVTGVARTAAGYTVNEFYTALDYPTVVKTTDLYRYNREPMPFFSMFQTKHETRVKVSQGYSIELNDMHGKPKAQYTYAEGKSEPLSWTKSIYQTDSSSYPNTLQNKVLTMAPDKTIKEKEIGVEFDFIMDSRQQNSLTYNAGIGFNTEAMALLIFPIVVPSILPSFSKEDTEFKSTVGTKVIKKYGILKETIAFQEGSTIKTSNLLYDDQTGSVLLTSVQNEFNDNIYSLTYPAHWAYDGMGQAYQNIGFNISGVEIQTDNIKLPSSLLSTSYLTPGDECLVTYPNGDQLMAWVYLGTASKLNFIDEKGYPLRNSKDVSFKVIRSGRRNLQKSPIATFTTLTNPLVKSGNNYSISIANVVNTEAIEYNQNWKSHLNLMQVYECDTMTNKNYRNFVNFLKVLPNAQSLVKTKYEADRPMYYRNDTLFTLELDGRRKVGSSFVYTQDTFNYGDSVFVIYKYTDDNDQWHQYKPLFVEIAGIKNVIPRPTELRTDGYDMFWAKVVRLPKPSWVMTSMGSAVSPLIDTLVEKLKYCGTVLNTTRSSLVVKYLYSTNQFNSKYEFRNTVNDCKCGFNFLFDKPNRYKTILSFYDFQPKDNSSLTCKTVVELDNGAKDTLNTVATMDCFKLMDCKYNCNTNLVEEKPINPYRAGIYGNWRVQKSYKYLGDRTYQTSSPNTRTDGTYTTFSSYWNYNTTTKKYEPNTTDAQWVNASQVTAYTPFGNEVENKDALGNYSAALFGYQNTLTTAVASNCRYTQLAFDGFEDYNLHYLDNNNECDQGHFTFKHLLVGGGSDVILDNSQQHTGDFSLKVTTGHEAVVTRAVSLLMLPGAIQSENEVKLAKLSDDLGVFRPGKGKYVLGAWIKSDAKIADTTYNNGLIEIELTDSNNVVTTITTSVSGKIIEGWQRIEKVFDIPANTKTVKVRLKAGSNYNVWFDDIRIHTYDGNMKSYVYDSRLLKLRAELDENNYATLYEYDQEGSLIRVKKETEKGIVTIKENRNHVKGNN